MALWAGNNPSVDDLLEGARSEQTRNPRHALELAKKAWHLASAGDDKGKVVLCRLALGWAHYYLSLPGEAAVHFNDALDEAVRDHRQWAEVEARTGLGGVFRQLGRFDSALGHLTEAWRLAEVLGHRLGEVRARITIGEVYLALGRPEEALQGLSLARDKAEGSQRDDNLLDTLLSLGQAYLNLGRSDEALEQLSRALVLAKELDSRIGEARALTLIGLVYRDRLQLEISEQYHLDCLQICQEVNHPWGQLDALFNLGDLLALRGQPEAALKYFDQVVTLATSLDAQSHLVKVSLRMADLWESRGELARALEATRSALARERRLNAEEASGNVRSLLDQFEAEQHRNHAEVLRLKSAKLEAESVELKKALDSLRVISELGRRITSSLTLSGLFQTLAESLGQLFDQATFGLALYHPLHHSVRYPQRIRQGVRLPRFETRPVGLSLEGWALRHRSTLLIRNLALEGGRYLDAETLAAVQQEQEWVSAVVLPLFAGDEPMGALSVTSPTLAAFDEVHAKFLETLSGFVVVALTNALSHRKVRRLNRQILRLAHYDPLTGLANRRLLSDYLKRTVALSQRQRRRFALFFLDLDGFKPINDQWGHAAGDFVLALMGKRLSACLRDSDLVARVGGDEFVALALEVDDRSSIEAIARKLADAITAPLVWQSYELRLGVSIGIAVFPDSASDADGLLNRADTAMYTIKRAGKNAWAFAENPGPLPPSP